MFRASGALRDGRSPYDADMAEAPFAAHYKYPPLFAELLSPLRPLGFRRAARVWLVSLETCYVASFALLVRAFGLRFRSTAFYLTAIIFLLFQPSLDSLGGGQLDALLLLLLAGAWWSLAGGRGTPAGALIALAAMLKVYPGLMASYFVLRRRWRALASCAAAALALALVSVVWAGWGPNAEFVTRVLPATAGGTAWVENQSLFGFFARFFTDGTAGGPGKETAIPAAAVLAAVTGAAVLALTLAAGFFTRDERALFGALIAALLLCLPVAWIHYEVILLIPLADLFARETDEGDAATRGVLLLATALLAFGNQHLMLRHAWVPHSFKLYGVLLVWALEMRRMWPWRRERSG